MKSKSRKTFRILDQFVVVNCRKIIVLIQTGYETEVSEPKWVNLILNIIGVNSLRLEDLVNSLNKLLKIENEYMNQWLILFIDINIIMVYKQI